MDATPRGLRWFGLAVEYCEAAGVKYFNAL
jgi:hypothetical protein